MILKLYIIDKEFYLGREFRTYCSSLVKHLTLFSKPTLHFRAMRFKTMLARRLGEPLLGAIKNKYLSVSLKVSLYRKRTDVDKKIKSW